MAYGLPVYSRTGPCRSQDNVGKVIYTVYCPVAHGEGRFSVLDIAALCNPAGNVMGLMPHPIITPTTKAGKGKHDERLTRQEILDQQLVAPDLWEEIEETAVPRNLHVIIAGAGGATHLPGMVAAQTEKVLNNTLPPE